MVASRTLFVFVATFIASATQATLADNPYITLVNRQASNPGIPNLGSIPDKCKDPCTKASNVVSNNCSSLSCLCGSSLSGPLSQCLQCGVNAAGDDSLVSEAQSAYDTYANNCKEAGMPVPSVNFKQGSGALSNKANMLAVGLLGGFGVSLFLSF